VRGAPSVNSAFKWPAPEQEGAPSHAHAARFGTDVDWGDGALPAEIGASRSFDAELEADNAEDPHCPEEARSSPRWRGHGVCCAAGLVGHWVSFYLRRQRRRAQWWLPPTTKLLSTTRCRPPVGAPRHGQM